MSHELREKVDLSVLPDDTPEDMLIIKEAFGTRDERYRVAQCRNTPIEILEKIHKEALQEDDLSLATAAKINAEDRGYSI